jgi:deazaflavin-dependent oxidoreductase (nitroreductase family)
MRSSRPVASSAASRSGEGRPGRIGLAATRALRLAYPFQAVFFRAHEQVYGASGGRVGPGLLGRPCLVLTTTGRSTGTARRAVLIYARDDGSAEERFVLAASNAGADRTPAWFRNLQADPRATVDVGRRTLAVLGRVATADERERLWPLMDAVNPGQYSRYQAISGREIPLVILEPVRDPADVPVGRPIPAGLGSMAGRVCVVTGATSGIGLATAVALARLGARLIITGRDRELGATALETIRLAAGPVDVTFLEADFRSLAETRRLAGEIAAIAPAIDVLVNNAGVWHLRRRETPDGLEEMFQVNVIAPFVLANLLRPNLRAAAPSRIITVTSHVHVAARMRWGEPTGRGGLDPLLGYARTKLADVILARELARRLRRHGIASNAVAPGGVRTKLAAEFGRPALRFMFLFAKHPSEGADPIVWLAAAPQVASVTGGYFVGRSARRLLRAASDPAAGARLWQLCEELTGIAD